ncbi:SCP2 sterol-binding domain-containing protein [Anaerolineales bacterium HSG6]|nr:SCP2 sterol-binding domain-containing protein [Anaerolineales bacterium HSG6]
MTDRATVDQSIQSMQNNFQPSRAEGLDVTYRLLLTGDGGGSWGLYIKNKQCRVREGAPRRTDVTITMNTDRYFQLSRGQLNVASAYQHQKINVTGNLQLALKFVELFPAWANSSSGGSGDSGSGSSESGGSSSEGAVQSSLVNGSFEEYQPFAYKGDVKVWKENQYPEKYGKYWDLDILDVGDSRPHLMDSETFGYFTQKYFSGKGLNYKAHGGYSQVITSRYSFDLVFKQTISARSGQGYTFKGRWVSYYKGSEAPYIDNIIFFTIGIDPTGGTDPRSGSVVWGERDGKNNTWRWPSVSATAQGDKITVFIRIENTEDDVSATELNTIHIDQFELG